MQKNKKRCTGLCSAVLVAVVVAAALPMTAFTASAESVLNCHHEHDDSCYEKNGVATNMEAQKLVCLHEHDESCYEEVLEEAVSVASPTDAQPELINLLDNIQTGAEYLAGEIDTWANGNGITTAVDGDTVVVTGTATASTQLKLVIPKGVTVEWRASLTGSDIYVVSIAIESEENTKFHMIEGVIASTSTREKSAALFNNNDTDIIVSGGRITGGNNENPDERCYGIQNDAINSSVTISGGIISSGSGNGNYALSNSVGSFTMTGGTITGGSGVNHGLYCHSCKVELSGGMIAGSGAEGSWGIKNYYSELSITGGSIINPRGDAINYVFIDESTKKDISISGSGVVFGGDVKNTGSTIVQGGSMAGQPTVSENGVIITWTDSKTEYENSSANDLIVLPATAKAVWDKKGGKGGISYEAGGANKGFIEVPGVTVKAAEKTLDSIAVTTKPTKTVYMKGENFDSTGMVVTAAYTDGSKKPVTGYTVSPSGALTVKDTSVTITYMEGAITKTAVQAIVVNGADDSDSGSGGSDSGSGDSGNSSGGSGGGSGDSGNNSGGSGGGSGDSGNSSGGSGSGSGGSGGGSGSGSGGSGGGSGGSGGGSGHLASSGGGLKVSLPKNYTGGTKIINNVKVPSYVEEVIWKAMEGGRWRLGRADGSEYVNTWVAAYNPYADLSIGQQAFDWFLFDGEGFMVTGWYTDGVGNTYYLNPVSDNTKGRMVTGWNVIDGKSYYFNEEPDGTRGKLYRNTMTPDGYHVNANGVWDGKGKQE